MFMLGGFNKDASQMREDGYFKRKKIQCWIGFDKILSWHHSKDNSTKISRYHQKNTKNCSWRKQSYLNTNNIWSSWEPRLLKESVRNIDLTAIYVKEYKAFNLIISFRVFINSLECNKSFLKLPFISTEWVDIKWRLYLKRNICDGTEK